MITNKDVEKLKETFVTKDDLTKELAKYATKEDLRSTTNELIELIKAFRQELKEDIVNFKDSILTEIVKLREDIAVTTGYRDMIEDHETRISKLESKSTSKIKSSN
ncbi:MAG: hypothetical protein Q7R95_01660 [bacterium]|nr:hypothetical protein [bacterium]